MIAYGIGYTAYFADTAYIVYNAYIARIAYSACIACTAYIARIAYICICFAYIAQIDPPYDQIGERGLASYFQSMIMIEMLKTWGCCNYIEL